MASSQHRGDEANSFTDPFVGRLDALSVLHTAAADAAAGRPRVVSIEGPAGFGKSALLRNFCARLDGWRIVSAEAEELAGHVSMALVEQVVVPSSADPFEAGLELVEHLAGLQADGPVALLVEDLHWADERSRQTLLMALRRLADGDAVLVVVSTRDDGSMSRDGWDRFLDDPRRCRRVRLDALSLNDVAVLATAWGVTLGPSARRNLHEQSAGHPLYVRTLLRELSAEQLRSPTRLPAPRSLAATTQSLVASLDPDAVDLLELLAVLGGTTSVAQIGRTGSVARPLEALETAIGSGLVEWRTTSGSPEVRFVHPLYRSAIYDSIGPVRRRQLHLAAASVTDPVNALHHRAAAAIGPDDALADELEAAAAASADAAVAGQLLVAAADLSTKPTDHDARLLTAGRRYLAAGLLSSLRRLDEPLSALPSSTRRDLLLAALDFHAGDVNAAQQRLDGAVEVDEDDEVRAEALVQLTELSILHGRSRAAIETGEAALRLGALDADSADFAKGLVCAGWGQLEGGTRGLTEFAARFPPTWTPDERAAPVVWARATVEAYAGHEPAAARWFELAIAGAPRAGVTRYLAHMHTGMARAKHALGEFDDALRHSHIALDLATDHDQVWIVPIAHAQAAQSHAARAEWERADAALAEAQRMVAALPTMESANVTALAGGYVAQAHGRPADVVASLAPFTAGGDAAMPAFFSLHFWPALVRALIELERLDDAAHELVELRIGVERRGMQLDAQLAALDGLLAAAHGDGATALDRLDAARALLVADTPFLDRVLVLRAGGRLLLQRGKRVQAVERLREARDLAAGSGAAAYVERLDADLHEAGLRAAPASRSPFDLTERERDVAVQVARGLTNKEVAAALYISSKAVEYHLGNIFAKLGVSSRRQLRDLVTTD